MLLAPWLVALGACNNLLLSSFFFNFSSIKFNAISTSHPILNSKTVCFVPFAVVHGHGRGPFFLRLPSAPTTPNRKKKVNMKKTQT
jgi:hypothetical protein